MEAVQTSVQALQVFDIFEAKIFSRG